MVRHRGRAHKTETSRLTPKIFIVLLFFGPIFVWNINNSNTSEKRAHMKRNFDLGTKTEL